MTSAEGVLAIVVQALEIMLLASAPVLGAALVTGLAVSILQAATQINEMTLAFIPRMRLSAIKGSENIMIRR